MRAGLVSIIIPVYNGSDHLEQAIQSALDQSYPDKELIVIDDGSRDESYHIACKFSNENVTVIRKENEGASKARNHALAVAKGKWIQFLDADDFLRKDKIEKQLSQLNSTAEVAVCKTVHFTNTVAEGFQDNDDFFKEHLNDPLRFLIKLYGGYDFQSGMIQPNAYLTHRSVIEKAGGWNESLSLDDDGEFFCRVVLNSSAVKYVPEPMNFYRKHESGFSLSGTKSKMAYQSQFNSIQLKHAHLLNKNIFSELIPLIHTASYKAAQLLLHTMYPHYPDLFTEVKRFSDSLIKHSTRSKEVFGGTVANFVGNYISWKLLRRLQILKASARYRRT